MTNWGPETPVDILTDKNGTRSFRLIHLDSPSANTREKRIAEIFSGAYFCDDCPICQHQKEAGGDIVFEPPDTF